MEVDSKTRKDEVADDPDADGDPNEEGGGDEEEARMMAAMGFGGFDTTKGKHVDGNQGGASKTNKQRTWRQYMNRYVISFLNLRGGAMLSISDMGARIV